MPLPPASRRHRGRPDHRARSHADAHAQSAGPRQALPDHPLIPRGAPVLLTQQAELDALLTQLRAAGAFAYDSEFIGEESYHPRLCLIQVATPNGIWLIDALARLELRGFWQLLADGSVLKIVHAAEQDVEPVVRLLGRPAAGVFDTQIAAGMAALSYPCSLSKLVRETLGVSLAKGFTFTHWDQRPLSPVQLGYAADDVRFLPAVHQALWQKLDGLGHTEWALLESAAWCAPARHTFDPERDYLRIRGAAGLAPREAAVLRQLYQWREDLARAQDLPPRTCLKDEILLALARRPITRLEDLQTVKGLPRPLEREQGPAILAATQQALAHPQHWPTILNVEETVAERFAADALWAVAQAWCFGQQVDPSLWSSRQDFGAWLQRSRIDPAAHAPFLEGWRGELAARGLLDVLSARAGMHLHLREGALESTVQAAG